MATLCIASMIETLIYIEVFDWYPIYSWTWRCTEWKSLRKVSKAKKLTESLIHPRFGFAWNVMALWWGDIHMGSDMWICEIGR
jgi:hypothetical protein